MWNWFPALNFQRITAKMNYSPRPHLSIDGWPLRRTSAALVSTWLINSELQKSQGEMWNMRRSTSRNEIRPSSFAQALCGKLNLPWKSASTRETYRMRSDWLWTRIQIEGNWTHSGYGSSFGRSRAVVCVPAFRHWSGWRNSSMCEEDFPLNENKLST